MLNQKSVEVHGNVMSVKREYSPEEMFFIQKFIWPRTTCTGKDLEIGDKNPISICLKVDGIEIMEAFKAEVSVAEAHTSILSKQTEICNIMNEELAKFWLEREKWEQSFKMTINALGLT